MKNLIEKLNIYECEYETGPLGIIFLKDCYLKEDIENLLNQYNIITAPKSIKLSEIVYKLKNNYSYEDVMIFRNSTYTRVVGKMQHHSFSSTETLFDIDFNNVLEKPNFKYKWLCTLWIASTEIIDDLEYDE